MSCAIACCLVFAIGLVLIVGTIFVAIFAGSHVEEKSVLKASLNVQDLGPYYEVCGYLGDQRKIDGFKKSDTKAFTTFNSAITRSRAGAITAHCGNCGQCSTVQDLEILRSTKDTLTQTVTSCAYMGFVPFSRWMLRGCIDGNVGFTEGCRDCWINNIQCTHKHCRYICMKSVLYGEKNTQDGKLNSCLECDEKMCGPAFASCAGANRRRAGIKSDIERSNEEVCDKIDANFIKVLESVRDKRYLSQVSDHETKLLLRHPTSSKEYHGNKIGLSF